MNFKKHLIRCIFSLGYLTVLPIIAQVTNVGKGGYLANLPTGLLLPQDSTGKSVDPQLTSDFSQPVITNKWWSSFLYKRVPAAHTFSGKSYPHPLSIRGAAGGLEMGYNTLATKGLSWEYEWAGNITYDYDHLPDMTVGINGMKATVAKSAGYSDWATTSDWTDGTKNLRATMAHGNPYVFFKVSGGSALIACTATPTKWYDLDGVLGITVNGHNWGIFAPTKSTWTTSGNNFTSDLSNKDYLSVAILPDSLTTTEKKNEAMALYKAHAYAFVTKTKVTWSYDEKNALVHATFTDSTEVKEGSETQTLQALYRHQWIYCDDALTNYTFTSPRGTMKLREGSTFSVTWPFIGVLPVFPDKGYDKATLTSYINSETGYNLYNGDTYNTGKSMGRVAQLIPIANQIGNASARDVFLQKLKDKLQAWFSASSGKGNQVFYYDKKWNTLLGCPTDFNLDKEMNDHHFHYAYFLQAAAAIAQFDPSWAAQANWGGMIDMLIKDVANIDETNNMFPRFRNFDVYEGHAWAHGSEYYGRGNNQESSSESMNFNLALYLLGLHTGNKALRDLGIFMYTSEALAIEQYWFDVDKKVFPSTYPHICVGQLMSNGGTYWTFFLPQGFANYVHLINFLPLTTGSVFLGRHPDYVKANIDYMYNNQPKVPGLKGRTGEWDDVAWGTLAFGDPAAAAGRFGNFGNYGAFDGESKAHVYHLVKNLEAIGIVNQDVRADIPSFGVFDKGKVRTYVAYNPDDSSRTVTFTDGTKMAVPSKGMNSSTGVATGLSGHLGNSAKAVVVKQQVVTGYKGILAAVHDNRNCTIYSLDGKMIWNAASGSFPLKRTFGNRMYIVRYFTAQTLKQL